MNTNQTKPTLETLLQSKKHDLPGEDFWIDLQKQVQGKALASLSEPSMTSRFLKYSYLTLPVLAVAIFCAVSFYPDTTKTPELSTQKVKPHILAKSPALSSEEDFHIIQNLLAFDYDFTEVATFAHLSTYDKSSFAEKTLEPASEKTFDVEYSSNFGHSQDDLLAQYTF